LGIDHSRLAFDSDVSANGIDLGYLAADTSGELHSTDDIWPIPSVALVMAPSEGSKWAWGAGVFWPYDVNYQWDLFRSPLGYNTDYEFHGKKNFHTDLDVMDVHPTIARRMSDNLSVGLGVSIARGDVVYRRVLSFDNELGDQLDDYPINNFYGDYRMEGNGIGVGANLGVLWKVSDKLSLGLNGQTPISISMDGTAELNMAWPINAQRRSIEADQFPERETSFFFGVNDEVLSEPSYFTQKYEYDLELPGSMGAGFGYAASDRLLLALDLAMTFWSAVDAWDVAFADRGLATGIDTMTSMAIPFGWEDQIRVSVGGEYMAKENLAVRGGFYYDGGAAVDSTFTPNFPDVGDRIGLTAGFSYMLSPSWELSAAQEIAFVSDRTIPQSGAMDGVTVFPGTYSLKRYETLLAFSYRF
jgi:long-chain fatty acid transport protein